MYQCAAEWGCNAAFLQSTLRMLLCLWFPENFSNQSQSVQRTCIALLRFWLVDAQNSQPVRCLQALFGATREWQVEKKTKKEEGKFAQLTPLPFAVEDENFRKLFVFILSCFGLKNRRRQESHLTWTYYPLVCVYVRGFTLFNAPFHRHIKETEGILHASHILNPSQRHQTTMSGGIGIYAVKKRKKPVQKM